MTKPALTLYDKIRDLIEKEGYVISSEQGFPDLQNNTWKEYILFKEACQMYLTAWNYDTRVQLNVKKWYETTIKNL